MSVHVNILVEGGMDEAAARRIIQATGHDSATCYGKRGFGYIKTRIAAFNKATHHAPLLAIVDFIDTGLSCAPEVLAEWVPHPNPNTVFRVAVRELESWLLADRKGLARFLRVSVGRIPRDPELIDNPKRALINVARHSRSSRIRDALVPRPRSTSQEGVLYDSESTRFIQESWSLNEARRYAPSLDQCIKRMERFSATP